jgi:hypothetical protein
MIHKKVCRIAERWRNGSVDHHVETTQSVREGWIRDLSIRMLGRRLEGEEVLDKSQKTQRADRRLCERRISAMATPPCRMSRVGGKYDRDGSNANVK